MTEFKLPELGENVHQGDLVRLMVAPGATIAEGQAVMELETDKAVVEVPSSVSGTIKDVLVKQGEKIKVGQVIFTVENGAGGKRAEATASSAPAPGKVRTTAPLQRRKEHLRQQNLQHQQHRQPPLQRRLFPPKAARPRNSSCPNSAKTFIKAIWFA